jgi:hypothetical protein
MKDFITMETLLAKLAFKKYAPKPTVPLNIIKLIMVNFLTMNSLLPAIISTKPLNFAELVHTIKMELPKTKTNS